jgi:hypothetical protein
MVMSLFDNLRQQSTQEAQREEEMSAPVIQRPRRSTSFLGLTPMQRFILALMLFLNVTVLGCFALIAFGQIALPF